MSFPPPSGPPAHVPAGWYQDPAGLGAYRFYDGHRWTGHTQGTPPRRSTVTPAVVSWRWAGIGAALALLCSTIFAFAALIAVAGGVDQLTVADIEALVFDPAVLLASAAGLWVGFAAAFVGAASDSRCTWRQAFGTVSAKAASAAFVAGVALQLSLIAALYAAGATDEGAAVDSGAGAELLVFAVVAVLGAPLFEELFFRGVLLPTFATRTATTTAIAVQAVVFGVLHFEQGVLGIAVTAAVGAILGWLRVTTRSLAAPIALHMGFNAAAVAALLLLT